MCEGHRHSEDGERRQRILLTGATGFIGRQVAPLLVQAGYEVHALARTSPVRLPGCGSVIWHECDLFDSHAVDAAVGQIQASHLVHLAWYAEHGKFWSASENLDCVAASLRLARSFVRSGGQRIVATGTCAEYDWTTGASLHEDDTPLKPKTLYGRSKASLFETLAPWAAAGGVSLAWARLFFLYGPGEDSRRLVPSLAQPLARGDVATCRFGNHLRDFLHVRDVASALVAILESQVTGAFNVASGRATRLGEVSYLLARELNAASQLRIDALPPTLDNPAALVADVTRLQREVGWSPQIELGTGLAEAARDWVRPVSGLRAAA